MATSMFGHIGLARRGDAAKLPTRLLALALTLAVVWAGSTRYAASVVPEPTRLSLSATSTVAYEGAATITGTLKTTEGGAIAGQSVTVQVSSNNAVRRREGNTLKQGAAV